MSSFIQFCVNDSKSSQASSFHSLSLLSLSEYAPNRLRDDEPFCVVTGLEALLETATDFFESEKQDTQWEYLMKEVNKQQKDKRVSK